MSESPDTSVATPHRAVLHDRHFAVDHLQTDLKGRSVRGGVVTFGAQGVKVLLHFAQTIILARLLAPTDFGLFAMVAPLTGFVGLFTDLGLSMATVQRQEVTHAQVSTLFWINVATSAVLMLITIALAPGVGWFYSDPRAVPITIALGTVFLLGGMTVQHAALLKRQMRFTALATMDTLALAAGVTTAAAAACLGAGYWSLVTLVAVQALTRMLTAWWLVGWRPGLPCRGSGVRDMLAFGGFLSGSTVMAHVRRNLDNVVLGAFCGAGPLGIYHKAYEMMMLPIQQANGPVSSVVIPALSRLQNDPESYRRYYCQALMAITSIGMPLTTFYFLAADDLVVLLLGDQWMGAIPIFKALAPAALAGTLNVGAWIYVSTGTTDRLFKANVCSTIWITMAIACGVPWGVLGVAIALSIAFCVERVPMLLYACYGSPVRFRDLITSIWRPALASLLSGLLLISIRPAQSHVDLLSILVQFVVFAFTYVVIQLGMAGRHIKSRIRKYVKFAVMPRH